MDVGEENRGGQGKAGGRAGETVYGWGLSPAPKLKYVIESRMLSTHSLSAPAFFIVNIRSSLSHRKSCDELTVSLHIYLLLLQVWMYYRSGTGDAYAAEALFSLTQ